MMKEDPQLPQALEDATIISDQESIIARVYHVNSN